MSGFLRWYCIGDYVQRVGMAPIPLGGVIIIDPPPTVYSTALPADLPATFV